MSPSEDVSATEKNTKENAVAEAAVNLANKQFDDLCDQY